MLDRSVPPEGQLPPGAEPLAVPGYNAPELGPGPEFDEATLARRHARAAESAYRAGDWTRAETSAAMATMYLSIATYKEIRRRG